MHINITAKGWCLVTWYTVSTERDRESLNQTRCRAAWLARMNWAQGKYPAGWQSKAWDRGLTQLQTQLLWQSEYINTNIHNSVQAQRDSNTYFKETLEIMRFRSSFKRLQYITLALDYSIDRPALPIQSAYQANRTYNPDYLIRKMDLLSITCVLRTVCFLLVQPMTCPLKLNLKNVIWKACYLWI